MAIYTKRGDQGTTGIYGSDERLSKEDPRFEALGGIDELNSQIGVVLSLLNAEQASLRGELLAIQEDLFEIASEVGTAKGKEPPFVCDSDKTRRLERFIDLQEGGLPVLGNFIFPGGSPAGAALHMARSICRRAERALVAHSRSQDVNSNVAKYLNRLSDYLFMAARLANHLVGTPEEKWKGK
ncbi:MAG: cob(I)yrinic acid a,c-diamide adenosyltransferase [Patescibacteria group bacterium]